MKTLIALILLSFITITSAQIKEDRTFPPPGYKIQISNGGLYRAVGPSGIGFGSDKTKQDAVDMAWYSYYHDRATRSWCDIEEKTNVVKCITNVFITECITRYSDVLIANTYTNAMRIQLSDEQQIEEYCKNGSVCKVMGHCWEQCPHTVKGISQYTIGLFRDTCKRKCKLCGEMEK